MSADTPLPERVTLSDEERESIEASLITPLDRYRTADDPLYVAVERILAAREQALREEIAGEIETARDDMCRVTRTDPRHTIARVYDEAARIAQGEIR